MLFDLCLRVLEWSLAWLKCVGIGWENANKHCPLRRSLGLPVGPIPRIADYCCSFVFILIINAYTKGYVRLCDSCACTSSTQIMAEIATDLHFCIGWLAGKLARDIQYQAPW